MKEIPHGPHVGLVELLRSTYAPRALQAVYTYWTVL